MASTTFECQDMSCEVKLPTGLPARLLCAIDRVRLGEARLSRAEAAFLGEARRRSWHEPLGYARFGDFAREALGMSPRSAWDLVALDRSLAGSELLACAHQCGDLSTCQVLALGPLLRKVSVAGETVIDVEELTSWIELARGLTVRELAARVRAARRAGAGGGGVTGTATATGTGTGAVAGAVADTGTNMAGMPIDDGSVTNWADAVDSDDLTHRIRFEAPPIVRAVLDETFELASRMLGRRASRWECLEVALIEAAPECAGAGLVMGGVDLDGNIASFSETGTKPADRSVASAVARDVVVCDVVDCESAGFDTGDRGVAGLDSGNPSTRRALATLDLVNRELDGLDDLIELAPVSSAEELLVRLQLLRSLKRPLRALLARLLRELGGSGILDGPDGGRLDQFVERRLHLSPRSARYLAAEARLFEDRPDLEMAWCHGRIGLAAALDIARVAPCRLADRWIERAEAVTARQFHREVVFRERLGCFAPEVARRHSLPFPEAPLEGDLWDALERRGGSRPEIAADLGVSGLVGDADSPVRPSIHRTTDPAEDPRLMRRLEAMLDHLILLSSDDVRSGLAALSAGAGRIPAGPGLSDRLTARQTFAHGGDRREERIRITLAVPRLVAAHWYAAIRVVGREFGTIPTWLAATILLARAARTWQRLDPDAKPTEWRVLDRDEYACQSPGCSARSRLEVHHVIPRARLGPDDPWNTVTLCHAHHHHGVHAGHIRVVHAEPLSVGGRAPGALRWDLGRRRDGGPLQAFRGERRIRFRPGSSFP